MKPNTSKDEKLVNEVINKLVNYRFNDEGRNITIEQHTKEIIEVCYAKALADVKKIIDKQITNGYNEINRITLKQSLAKLKLEKSK